MSTSPEIPEENSQDLATTDEVVTTENLVIADKSVVTEDSVVTDGSSKSPIIKIIDDEMKVLWILSASIGLIVLLSVLFLYISR